MAIDTNGAQDDTAELSFSLRLQFRVLALVYFSPNFLDAAHRAIVAILVLVYPRCLQSPHCTSFYFFQRIERLEVEARRLALAAAEGPSSSASREQIVGDVAILRHVGEIESSIDFLFLALVILLCFAKIVTN